MLHTDALSFVSFPLRFVLHVLFNWCHIRWSGRHCACGDDATSLVLMYVQDIHTKNMFAWQGVARDGFLRQATDRCFHMLFVTLEVCYSLSNDSNNKI